MDLFHLVCVLVVSQARCRLLFYSLLLNVQVDHKCNNLSLDSFLFLSVVPCSCLYLCLLWLVVSAAIAAYLCLFLCCSYRSPCHIGSPFVTVVLSFAFTFELSFSSAFALVCCSYIHGCCSATKVAADGRRLLLQSWECHCVSLVLHDCCSYCCICWCCACVEM